MISRKQLEAIANTTKIGLYYQEKDYLLNIFLYLLYRESKELIFKGGTCLKFAYNYPRFSEDLDFNTKLKSTGIRRFLEKILDGFLLLDIEGKIAKEEVFKESVSLKMRFKGVLFNGRDETRNAIRIDAGFRGGTVLKPEWRQIISPYADVPNYFALCMQENEIFSEKIRALLARGKPRDMFDVWLMMKKNKLDASLLGKKLKQSKMETPKKLIFPKKAEYENDLKNLIAVVPDYAQVVSEIKEFLAAGKIVSS